MKLQEPGNSDTGEGAQPAPEVARSDQSSTSSSATGDTASCQQSAKPLPSRWWAALSALSASDKINLGVFVLAALGLCCVYAQIRLAREEIKYSHRPWVWIDDVGFAPVQVGKPLVVTATVKNTGGSGVENLSVFSLVEALAPRSSRSTYKPTPPREEDIRLAGRDVVTFQSGIAPTQELPIRIELYAPKALTPPLARDIGSGAAILEVVLTVAYESPLLVGNEVVTQVCYYYDSQSQTTTECRARGQAPSWPDVMTRARTLSPTGSPQ